MEQWNELQAVPAYCERFVIGDLIASECDIADKLLIVVNEQGEELHTADRPFCCDMRCECHFDSELWQAYIYQPWLDGILTIDAGAALFSGR